MNLLIVEDETAVRRLLVSEFQTDDVNVTEASTKAAALTELNDTDFDVAILDLTLPDGSGLDVLEVLRGREPSPHVIILSGAASETERVRGLELGADDYVVKPFYMRELVARVAAARRRHRSTGRQLNFGKIKLDISARSVTIDGGEVDLSAKEFDLFAFLAERPGRAFGRDELLRSVWRSSLDFQHAATVTEHIWRLRKKLETDPHRPQLLQTVRSVGYRFVPPTAS
ncbi:MAG TPA: response regulator transcription factor [Ilumatobacteraceae bacterium]|jgi:DNA-binding response OmpR family regulator